MLYGSHEVTHLVLGSLGTGSLPLVDEVIWIMGQLLSVPLSLDHSSADGAGDTVPNSCANFTNPLGPSLFVC